jgi:hypothetical protein
MNYRQCTYVYHILIEQTYLYYGLRAVCCWLANRLL